MWQALFFGLADARNPLGPVPGYSAGISGSTRAASWVRDSCQPR